MKISKKLMVIVALISHVGFVITQNEEKNREPIYFAKFEVENSNKKKRLISLVGFINSQAIKSTNHKDYWTDIDNNTLQKAQYQKLVDNIIIREQENSDFFKVQAMAESMPNCFGGNYKDMCGLATILKERGFVCKKEIDLWSIGQTDSFQNNRIGLLEEISEIFSSTQDKGYGYINENKMYHKESCDLDLYFSIKAKL
jgi:hypothetical protein